MGRSTLPDMAHLPLGDALLAVGATVRLTRLVTTDSLGEHLIRTPAERWAARHPEHDWKVAGLYCPFCAGYWLGAAVLVAHAATSNSPRARGLWRLGAATLALNYVVGHVSARLDD